MISRSALTRGGQLALRRQGCATAQRRGYAAAATAPLSSSTSASFESTDIAGIKVASKDNHGPTTRLAVFARAGTRYQTAADMTVGLQEFAFKNTNKRSALRITRESELLGGQLTAYSTREALVLEASFLRNDLPYFTELLAEVITQTRFTTAEFKEDVVPIAKLKQERLSSNNLASAVDAAHGVAFHSGLGLPLSSKLTALSGGQTDEWLLEGFAQTVYTKPNIAIVADGATQSNTQRWIDQLFKDVSTTPREPKLLNNQASKYHGGEQRVAAPGENAMVIGFHNAAIDSASAANAVLVALLGGESAIKWTPGFTLLSKAAAAAPGATVHAKQYSYSDAGLLTIQVTGSPSAVRDASVEAVKAIQGVAEGKTSAEDLKKAIAKAKFDALTANELSGAGLVFTGTSLLSGAKPFQVADAVKGIEGVTADKLKSAAKALLESRASVGAVGDLFTLPYADQLGLKV